MSKNDYLYYTCYISLLGNGNIYAIELANNSYCLATTYCIYLRLFVVCIYRSIDSNVDRVYYRE